MWQYPLQEVVDSKDAPELQYGSNLDSVVVHEELEGVEGGDVKSQ